MGLTRRDFFKRTGCALGATALLAGIEQLSLIDALAQTPQAVTDYRALVCIFLSGGNDCNNTIVPYTDYNATGGYNSVRSASGLAIPQSSLLKISPPNTGGLEFGFHPNLSPEQASSSNPPGLLPIWQAGKLAILCNVGTLVQPLTRALYQSTPSARPYQLFSHSDQVTQQQTSVSNTPGQTGWGGRISDVLSNVNGAAPLPMIISTAGTALFTTGQTTRSLSVAPAPTALNQIFVLSMSGTSAEQTSRRAAFDQIRALDNNLSLVKATNDTTAQALQTSAALSQDQTLTTVFPATSLGNQLKQIAKLIKANLTQSSLNLKRQIFFCTLGGFDTHTNQTSAALAGNQGNLFTQLSQAMNAFYNAMLELEQVSPGISSQVATFTQSDFGRTFQPSGSGTATVGSDHGWGNHQFIMGGAVLGGRFYGTYPTLALGGPDDTDTRGRWIPTTSVDQYAATLARWYGVADVDVPTVFPFIGRFATSNLGFLG
ncbi:MAG TPA: DUF1501 domain-containing protein [Pyrinomonadaceae bacterium]|nr:DUF1501 domain-containing protein [Pyrinomonadaceae bacterium]